MGLLWSREPALIVGFVQAALMLGITFGLHLTVEQVGAISAVLAALFALLTRSQVASPSTVNTLSRF
jgi:hypothetical protein